MLSSEKFYTGVGGKDRKREGEKGSEGSSTFGVS